jgi:hypothetical protein
MLKTQLGFRKMIAMSVAMLFLGAMAAVATDNPIPNLSNFGGAIHGFDANGALILQGSHPNTIYLSGYYNSMANYRNVFFAQAEVRGFTATASGGESGGDSTGPT